MSQLGFFFDFFGFPFTHKQKSFEKNKVSFDDDDDEKDGGGIGRRWRNGGREKGRERNGCWNEKAATVDGYWK